MIGHKMEPQRLKMSTSPIAGQPEAPLRHECKNDCGLSGLSGDWTKTTRAGLTYYSNTVLRAEDVPCDWDYPFREDKDWTKA